VEVPIKTPPPLKKGVLVSRKMLTISVRRLREKLLHRRK
jgi:hypothetical protein